MVFILYARLHIARDAVRDFHDRKEILQVVVAADLHYRIRSRIPIPGARWMKQVE